MCVCVCVCVRAGRLLPVGVHSRMTVPDQQCWGPWAYQLGSEEWTKLQSPPDPEAGSDHCSPKAHRTLSLPYGLEGVGEGEQWDKGLST